MKRDPLYLSDKPYVCLMDVSSVPNASATNIQTVDVPSVPICDVRTLGPAEEPRLRVHGFEVVLLDPQPDPEQFTDTEWLTSVFYARAREIVLEKTGAKDARVFEHQLRYRHPGFGRPDLSGPPGFDVPVQQVHADQTSPAAWRRLRRYWLELADDQAALSNGFGIVKCTPYSVRYW
ncbi:hypothetical protein F4680DRAFT_433172 [Xylaria scruposa]|nr:hypothetical protein F4680DRAFT_433172 [Xylaria scruposa]